MGETTFEGGTRRGVVAVERWDETFAGLIQGHWNGFAIPYFGETELRRIAALLKGSGNDVGRLYEQEGQWFYRLHPEEEAERLPEMTDSEGATLFGMPGWCWVEMDKPEPHHG